MAPEAPDRARPGQLLLAIGALAAAVAGGYVVRVLVSDR
jgi:hypothetical protein